MAFSGVDIGSEELRGAAEATPERVRVIYGQIVCSIAALPNPPSTSVLIFDAEGRISPIAEGATVLTRAAGPADYRDCQTAADIAAEEADASASTSTPADQ